MTDQRPRAEVLAEAIGVLTRPPGYVNHYCNRLHRATGGAIPSGPSKSTGPNSSPRRLLARQR